MEHSSLRASEHGNVLIIILITLALLGALTVAVQGTGSNNNIDSETLLIRAGEVQRYGSELERGIRYIMQNGVSEVDIRFAHPDADSDYGDLSADTDKSDQVFDRRGGGAQYRAPPNGINNDDAWEFYGNTALPDVGSDEPELIAVLPNVTQAFCDRINTMIGYTDQPEDSSTCIHSGASARFDDVTQFSSSPNTVTDSSFSVKPSMQGCVECTSASTYHYYRVLMTR